MNEIDPLTVDQVVPNEKLGINDRGSNVRKIVAVLVLVIGAAIALKSFVLKGDEEPSTNPMGVAPAAANHSPTEPVSMPVGPDALPPGIGGGYVPDTAATIQPAQATPQAVPATQPAAQAPVPVAGVLPAPVPATQPQVAPSAPPLTGQTHSSPVVTAHAAPEAPQSEPPKKVATKKPGAKKVAKKSEVKDEKKEQVREAAAHEDVDGAPVEEMVTTEEILVIR